MEKYAEILKEVKNSEITSTAISIIVVLAVISVIWVSGFVYFKRQKKKRPKKYGTAKQIRLRRQSLWAGIALTAIAVGFGAFLLFDTASLVSDINKDVSNGSYLTYEGGCTVRRDSRFLHFVRYDRWYQVELDNGHFALLYMDSFAEWASTDVGPFEGKVVYGKNSLIVVDVDQ